MLIFNFSKIAEKEEHITGLLEDNEKQMEDYQTLMQVKSVILNSEERIRTFGMKSVINEQISDKDST